MSSLQVTTSRVRVLVVDDSAFVRRAIIRMFDNSKDISIIDVASDGQMAIDLIKKHQPDVVTLDVQMPVLDGISALERIMKECPVPVVMLSSLTGRGGEQTLRALELGAVEQDNLYALHQNQMRYLSEFQPEGLLRFNQY